jgi:hypothetical protein
MNFLWDPEKAASNLEKQGWVCVVKIDPVDDPGKALRLDSA